MKSRATRTLPAKVRTTVTLDRDVASALERFQSDRAVGLSEAVNDLIRAGLIAPRQRKPFVQKTHDFGEFKVDIANIGDALEELEGPSHH